MRLAFALLVGVLALAGAAPGCDPGCASEQTCCWLSGPGRSACMSSAECAADHGVELRNDGSPKQSHAVGSEVDIQKLVALKQQLLIAVEQSSAPAEQSSAAAEQPSAPPVEHSTEHGGAAVDPNIARRRLAFANKDGLLRCALIAADNDPQHAAELLDDPAGLYAREVPVPMRRDSPVLNFTGPLASNANKTKASELVAALVAGNVDASPFADWTIEVRSLKKPKALKLDALKKALQEANNDELHEQFFKARRMRFISPTRVDHFHTRSLTQFVCPEGGVDGVGLVFDSDEINQFFVELFEAVTDGASLLGTTVRLSRWDLFHGHFFVSGPEASSHLGVLFRAQEHPRGDGDPCSMESNVELNCGSVFRNFLWLADTGKLYAINTQRKDVLQHLALDVRMRTINPMAFHNGAHGRNLLLVANYFPGASFLLPWAKARHQAAKTHALEKPGPTAPTLESQRWRVTDHFIKKSSLAKGGYESLMFALLGDAPLSTIAQRDVMLGGGESSELSELSAKQSKAKSPSQSTLGPSAAPDEAAVAQAATLAADDPTE